VIWGGWGSIGLKICTPKKLLWNDRIIHVFCINTYFTVSNVPNDRMTHPWILYSPRKLQCTVPTLLSCKNSSDTSRSERSCLLLKERNTHTLTHSYAPIRSHTHAHHAHTRTHSHTHTHTHIHTHTQHTQHTYTHTIHTRNRFTPALLPLCLMAATCTTWTSLSLMRRSPWTTTPTPRLGTLFVVESGALVHSKIHLSITDSLDHHWCGEGVLCPVRTLILSWLARLSLLISYNERRCGRIQLGCFVGRYTSSSPAAALFPRTLV